MMLVLFAIALALTGAATGVIAGLLGVGGGIVIVPVLYLVLPVFGVDEALRMHLAVGTSLATIIPTALASARSHHHRGAVDGALLRVWGPAVFAGAVLGAALAGPVGGAVLTAVFATVALLVAAQMGFGNAGPPGAGAAANAAVTGPVGAAIAALVGFVSTWMGIGGGTLSVPIFTALGVPIHRAVGTAAALGLVIGVPGAIGFAIAGWGVPGLPPASLGYVNLIALALIVPLSALCSPLGARLAHAISARLLRRAFAVFLAATAARMFYGLLAG